MKKKGKMAACLILLVLLLAVLVVLTKKNSTADADSSSSDSGADAEKVVDFSKDDVTALSFQINGETVSFTKTAGDDDTDIWTYDQEDGFPLDEGKITNVLRTRSWWPRVQALCRWRRCCSTSCRWRAKRWPASSPAATLM